MRQRGAVFLLVLLLAVALAAAAGGGKDGKDSGKQPADNRSTSPKNAPPPQKVQGASGSSSSDGKNPPDGGKASRDEDNRQAMLKKWRQRVKGGDGTPTTPEPPATTIYAPNEAVDSAEAETNASTRMFIVLTVLAGCCLFVHLLHRSGTHALPESVAIILFGVFVGMTIKLMAKSDSNVRQAEAFDPTAFFLFLLPPIIFESSYSMHRSNFFDNFGTILVFAIIGTIISTIVIGVGLVALGDTGLIYKLSAIESFTISSALSATDPISSLAIFNALNLDRTLTTLVAGESCINDCISIVLTRTIIKFGADGMNKGVFHQVCVDFLLASFGSAGIGIVAGLGSALVFKHTLVRQSSSLEFSMLIIFAYLPYVLAEALDLSGIMSILFCGITMAHYTHYNLSPTSQVTAQQTFQAIAFLAETCVFLYLGLAIFSYSHVFHPGLILATILLCLMSRAANIYPLSLLVNYFRKSKINMRMQFIMWFSGLRGAIAFALILSLPKDIFSQESRNVLLTTTLVIVIMSNVLLGGTTLPLIKMMQRRGARLISGSVLPEHSDDDGNKEKDEATTPQQGRGRFSQIDRHYLTPFFRRNLTHNEVKAAKSELDKLSSEWFSRLDSEDTAAPSPAGSPRLHRASFPSSPARAISRSSLPPSP